MASWLWNRMSKFAIRSSRLRAMPAGSSVRSGTRARIRAATTARQGMEREAAAAYRERTGNFLTTRDCAREFRPLKSVWAILRELGGDRG